MKGRAIQRTKKKTMRLSATCEPAKNRREKRRKEDDERIKRSNDDDNDDAGDDRIPLLQLKREDDMEPSEGRLELGLEWELDVDRLIRWVDEKRRERRR
ncbi:hypothetical protein PRIPAC_97816, partial [Pristionchus pacificus]|uniref:Uncharacterized protein n=1 Tax=Pristionchus pacificus TaxID=54126 RepID=A0A2A6D1A8_PRIPA